MAKFTVYFKEKAIQSHIFDSKKLHIGRDETNDLIIDNLAVAPAHAVVVIKDNNCIIKQLNDDYPILINKTKAQEAILKNNDKITFGKHTVIYNVTESVIGTGSKMSSDVNTLNGKLNDKVQHILEANLQVMDGTHIGRILPLKKAMTRLGHSGSGIIIISKRKEGYFVSSLEANDGTTINKQTLKDKTIHLNNNDIVVLDNVSMQFFIDS